MQKFQIDVLTVASAVLMVPTPYSHLHSQDLTLSLSMAFDFLSWTLWVCFTFSGLPKAELTSSVFVINTRGALLPHKSRSCGVKELILLPGSPYLPPLVQVMGP